MSLVYFLSEYEDLLFIFFFYSLYMMLLAENFTSWPWWFLYSLILETLIPVENILLK